MTIIGGGGTGGGGEINTVSNVGVGGVGLYKQKIGFDFELKKVNAGSNKVTITDDVANNEVDVDVVEANLAIGNIGGTLGIAKGGTGQVTKAPAFNALSPATTKGDITIYNGVDNVRIAVGPDGQVLTADSVQASGVKWAGGAVQPIFHVHKNGVNQVGIVPGIATKITWSTEAFDTNNNFALDKFTPSIAGKYLFHAVLIWVSPVEDQKTLMTYIYKNGVSAAEGRVFSSGVGYQGVSVVAMLDANGSTDYFETFVYQGTTANRDIYGNFASSYFEGYRIGA
ncbi:MAG TPA: hypothetical protein ENI76_10875 [Ignavibacteria bacterium]|nr:hypothetical protein [Ignavibacteria bacterium]